jgi:Flp pilus assembly protein TadB
VLRPVVTEQKVRARQQSQKLLALVLRGKMERVNSTSSDLSEIDNKETKEFIVTPPTNFFPHCTLGIQVKVHQAHQLVSCFWNLLAYVVGWLNLFTPPPVALHFILQTI